MAAAEPAEGGMDPALYKAATYGCVWSLRKLVAGDLKALNSKTPQGNTALHVAASHGHAKFARGVLKLNEELIVAENADGDTPLHLAAKNGRLKVAELMISLAQARADHPSTKARAEDPGETDGKLLQTPLTMTNGEGNTPLHEVVRHQHTDVALKLLVADSKCAHDLNNHSESPLDMAARQGLVQVVRRIVDVPWVPDKDKVIKSVGVTALHQAVVEIMLEKHHYLLDRSDSGGNNALHYAAQKDNKRVVKRLLKERTELAYKRNGQNQTPLHVAAHHGSTNSIRALLQQCPDVAEMLDAAGRNAFHAAVASGKTDALRCLLRNVRPADLLNHVDDDGNTPLLLAAEMSHVQSALLLVRDSRVNPCIRNKKGQTARSLLEARSAQDRTTHSEVKIRTVDGGGEQEPHTHLEIRTSHKYFERSVETYILVATLIATVTFAATFTMPVGYDQTKGIALHGHNAAFKIFVISNTVAMCSAIIVVFCFIWAWKNPIKFMVDQLLWGHRLTIIACLAMLVSLMTTVYITVAPTSRWPAYVVIAIGISTPAVVVLILGKEMIFVPL
ncbi:ankyrin repeat-containing protein [Panicum miliaceum]|uniref:Ankyrin repeat-containing protein n=1 Tax=Panicum miliaceum TaxID=4540 RepID=A0A3L6TLJ9_PANMI|nr:ankyrin repeat-containing protein [Panicum miliaceum]